MCIVSIASLFDPSLAPPGQHTVHVYCAANEPWALWKGQKRSTKEYKELKVPSWAPVVWGTSAAAVSAGSPKVLFETLVMWARIAPRSTNSSGCCPRHPSCGQKHSISQCRKHKVLS